MLQQALDAAAASQNATVDETTPLHPARHQQQPLDPYGADESVDPQSYSAGTDDEEYMDEWGNEEDDEAATDQSVLGKLWSNIKSGFSIIADVESTCWNVCCQRRLLMLEWSCLTPLLCTAQIYGTPLQVRINGGPMEAHQPVTSGLSSCGSLY
jgi:hypothetical protein